MNWDLGLSALHIFEGDIINRAEAFQHIDIFRLHSLYHYLYIRRYSN